MNKLNLRVFLITCAVILLSACSTPDTPQEVTRAFWEAVLNNDAGKAAKYSTLVDPQKYDGFSKDWTGYQPSWGKVVIEGNKASVESEFFGPARSGQENRQLTTYLVRIDEQWKVDYDRTGQGISGGTFGELFDRLSQMGDEFSQQLQYSSSEFNAEMERLGDELEAKSSELDRQASEIMDRYAKELNETIDELVDSINRALEDGKEKLSDKDRQVLIEVSNELEAGSKELSDPDAQSIAENSVSIGHAQVRLQSVDNDAFSEYQKQWQELTEQYKQDVENMLAELKSSWQQ